MAEPRDTTGYEVLDAGRTVLIVEDEVNLRRMLVRAVAEMEFVPIEAADAERGLSHMETERIDIVLADLHLPGISGLDLCERVRERWPLVQVLILTGHGDLEAARRAIHLDVVEFLTKPCPLREIEEALDRALRRRRHGVLSWVAGRASAVTGRDAAGPNADRDAGPDAGTEGDPEAVDEGGRASRLDDMEREHILDMLARQDGNRADTARELGISIRTLYYRLASYEKLGYIVRHPADE